MGSNEIMRLVEDWRQSWRWISINCMVLAASVQGAWLYIPEELRDKTPHGVAEGLTMGLLALGIGGRLTRQGNPDDSSVVDDKPCDAKVDSDGTSYSNVILVRKSLAKPRVSSRKTGIAKPTGRSKAKKPGRSRSSRKKD
jgi:hypothetical protein